MQQDPGAFAKGVRTRSDARFATLPTSRLTGPPSYGNINCEGQLSCVLLVTRSDARLATLPTR